MLLEFGQKMDAVHRRMLCKKLRNVADKIQYGQAGLSPYMQVRKEMMAELWQAAKTDGTVKARDLWDKR